MYLWTDSYKEFRYIYGGIHIQGGFHIRSLSASIARFTFREGFIQGVHRYL